MSVAPVSHASILKQLGTSASRSRLNHCADGWAEVPRWTLLAFEREHRHTSQTVKVVIEAHRLLRSPADSSRS